MTGLHLHPPWQLLAEQQYQRSQRHWVAGNLASAPPLPPEVEPRLLEIPDAWKLLPPWCSRADSTGSSSEAPTALEAQL